MGRSTTRRSIAIAFLALQFGTFAPPCAPGSSVAWAQSASVSPAIRAGWQFWKDEEHLEAIASLRNALKNPSLGSRDRIDALRIIAQSHVRLNDEAAAVAAFHEILDLDPAWTPDPAILQPDEMDVFRDKAKPTWKPPVVSRSIWKNPWVLGAGGAALATGIVLLTRKSSDSTPAGPLPGPPGPPTSRGK